jgi:hypothetical protein
MSLEPLLLSRIQFGFTVSFHIIFPAFTIGLAAWLATMEGMRLATGNPVYQRLFAGSRSPRHASPSSCLALPYRRDAQGLAARRMPAAAGVVVATGERPLL